MSGGAPSASRPDSLPAHYSSGVLRALDVVLALGGLIVTSPLIVFALGLIALESRGNPIFAQPRVGRGERVFVCYKLRTMKSGSASVGTHEISSAQVTRVGLHLRRLKIDELPQLFNVVRGDMSLVGPRPCLPNQDEVIAARRAQDVFSVRPGITGAAQLAGIDMSMPVELALKDRDHLDMSAAAYVSAVIATVLGGGRGDRIKADA